MKNALKWFALLSLPAVVSAEGLAQPPNGWWKAGSNHSMYVVGTDQGQAVLGRGSALIESTRAMAPDFGGIGQSISAANFAGKRVRLAGMLKTQDVSGWSGLWMRLDAPDGRVMTLDNMASRPVVGTTEWQEQQVVLDVPQNAKRIVFGAIQSGSGRTWVDEIRIEEAKDTEVTARPAQYARYNEPEYEELPSSPINAGFEQ